MYGHAGIILRDPVLENRAYICTQNLTTFLDFEI